MKIKHWGLSLLIAAIPFLSNAQKNNTPPANWFNLDLQQDGVFGISTEKAYQSLLQGRKGSPVIVAVIDGGVDVAHEDLKSRLWINTLDSAATGLDADNNGYANDKYGWNFIGNANGENVQYDNLEITRLMRELEPKYISTLPSTPMGGEERREFEAYQRMVREYARQVQQAQNGQVSYRGLKITLDNITTKIGKESPEKRDFDKYKPANDLEKLALRIVRSELKTEPDYSKLREQIIEGIEYFDNQVAYHLNQEFESRHIVGDDYENSQEQHYGNPDVTGSDAEHGTHVAGIIAAQRHNNIGINGVSDQVLIMSIRAVPDGDERDKDIANGIRYAVDNGAKVINMSFGKSYTKDKQIVDEAVRHAMANDVLLIHAAGNDGKDIDLNPNFPNKYYVDSLGINQGTADAWITVGATSWENNANLVATFSNYGQKTVDVFAPGVKINSTMPGSEYKDQDGTSMAAPVVAGLAALIRSYFPELSAIEVKDIIIQSVTPVKQRVKIKHESGRTVRTRLDQISVSGGVVNAYQAIELAIKKSN